ncbi:MAG: hypothetical protein GXY57_03515 [Erysipelotrichaceae bacterium]|nr:hypothetical protein [Erysipelotrichaceae bacterium]
MQTEAKITQNTASEDHSEELAAFEAVTDQDLRLLIDAMINQGISRDVVDRQDYYKTSSYDEKYGLVVRYELSLKDALNVDNAFQVSYYDVNLDMKIDTYRFYAYSQNAELAYEITTDFPKALCNYVTSIPGAFEYMEVCRDAHKQEGSEFPQEMTYKGGLNNSPTYVMNYDDGKFMYKIERLTEDPASATYEISIRK